MQKAIEQAEGALAVGEFPVGCVMVYRDRILVTGTRRGTIGNSDNEIDHAEMVALRRLAHKVHHVDHRKITVFCTMEPCLMCYSAIILAGIAKVVFAYEDVMGGGTECDLEQLRPLYSNSRIEVLPGVLRDKSLQLFKTYFSDPMNHYWKGSVLAQYTLNQ